MLRAFIIFLALFMGIGIYIPLLANSVEASAERPQKFKKNRKKYKKYSKPWWRAYNKRVKQQRAAAARRRALRLHRIRIAASLGKDSQTTTSEKSVLNSDKKSADAQTDLQFNFSGNSPNAASTTITVIGAAMESDADNARAKTIGGVPVVSLRRTIIDQMVREEGWVANDYQKEIGGKKVYFVVAYSPGAKGAGIQSRLFYFTEADKRIYRVASSAPEKQMKSLETEAEKIVASLQKKSSGVQQAELR